MTIHVVATELETGKVHEITVPNGDYCIVSHGAAALPDPADIHGLGQCVAVLDPAEASSR